MRHYYILSLYWFDYTEKHCHGGLIKISLHKLEMSLDRVHKDYTRLDLFWTNHFVSSSTNWFCNDQTEIQLAFHLGPLVCKEMKR